MLAGASSCEWTCRISSLRLLPGGSRLYSGLWDIPNQWLIGWAESVRLSRRAEHGPKTNLIHLFPGRSGSTRATCIAGRIFRKALLRRPRLRISVSTELIAAWMAWPEPVARNIRDTPTISRFPAEERSSEVSSVFQFMWPRFCGKKVSA